MLYKAAGQFTKTDVDALVTGKVAEVRSIEYKEKLPDRSDGAKHEFLADVSSFANDIGGHLFFGLRAGRDPQTGKTTGVPEAALGLTGANPDADIATLETLIRTWIQPRLHVETAPVAGFPQGPVIVLHVPRSFSAPHMITFEAGSTWRFFTRNSVGKHPMSVDEIRTAFLVTDSLGERLRRFREDRVLQIRSGKTPVPLAAISQVVMHVIPYSAGTGFGTVSVPLIASQVERLGPIIGMGWNFRFNLDGFVTYSTPRNEPQALSYVQVFRTGALEAVDAATIGQREGRLIIPGYALEQRLIEALGKYLGVLQALGVAPPLAIALSLLNIKGGVLGEDLDPGRYPRELFPLMESEILTPEISIDKYGDPPHVVLRPAFDMMWQALGRSGSPHYDESGAHVPPR